MKYFTTAEGRKIHVSSTCSHLMNSSKIRTWHACADCARDLMVRKKQLQTQKPTGNQESLYTHPSSHLGSNRLIARTPLRQQCISDASSSIHRRTPASSIPLPAAAFPCQQCIHRRTCATTHSLARCRTFDGGDADAGLSARAMARWHGYVLHPQ